MQSWPYMINNPGRERERERERQRETERERQREKERETDYAPKLSGYINNMIKVKNSCLHTIKCMLLVYRCAQCLYHDSMRKLQIRFDTEIHLVPWHTCLFGLNFNMCLSQFKQQLAFKYSCMQIKQLVDLGMLV